MEENGTFLKWKEAAGYLARLFGFLLIVTGVVMILVSVYGDPPDVAANAPDKQRLIEILIGKRIAVNFFIVMLGMCFAFPSLLKGGDDNLSTMRIVVFMMINVICMLMLKNGWGVEDLSKIGIDANWMGIIAFVFGAKVVQSYFEHMKK